MSAKRKAERQKAYYDANRMNILAKGRQRYAEPDGKRKAWYAASHDRRLAQQRKQYAANKEALQQKRRQRKTAIKQQETLVSDN